MSFHHNAGKGGKPRPVKHDKFIENWDTVFSKKKLEPVTEEVHPTLAEIDETCYACKRAEYDKAYCCLKHGANIAPRVEDE